MFANHYRLTWGYLDPIPQEEENHIPWVDLRVAYHKVVMRNNEKADSLEADKAAAQWAERFLRQVQEELGDSPVNHYAVVGVSLERN